MQSTPRKLLEALAAGTQSGPKASCFIGSVQYLEKNALLQEIANAVDSGGLDVFEHPGNRAKLLLMKREAFAHEAEVRLMVVRHRSDSPDTVFRIRIDQNVVFDEITFDPRLEIFERKEREAVIRKLGYSGPFRESQLYQGVILQVLLDKPANRN